MNVDVNVDVDGDVDEAVDACVGNGRIYTWWRCQPFVELVGCHLILRAAGSVFG